MAENGNWKMENGDLELRSCLNLVLVPAPDAENANQEIGVPGGAAHCAALRMTILAQGTPAGILDKNGSRAPGSRCGYTAKSGSWAPAVQITFAWR